MCKMNTAFFILAKVFKQQFLFSTQLTPLIHQTRCQGSKSDVCCVFCKNNRTQSTSSPSFLETDHGTTGDFLGVHHIRHVWTKHSHKIHLHLASSKTFLNEPLGISGPFAKHKKHDMPTKKGLQNPIPMANHRVFTQVPSFNHWKTEIPCSTRARTQR